MFKLSCNARPWFLLLLAIPATARADDDAGVDTATAPDGAAPPDAPSAEPPSAEPPISPPAEAPHVEHQKKHDKHKAKSDDETALSSAEQGDITGDDHASLGPHSVSFRFLFQTRYLRTLTRAVDPDTELDPRLGDGYALNRIFMRLTTKPKPWLSAKLLIDFSELARKNPKRALKLAYTEIELHPRAVVTVGLFKRTYSLLELLPIADFELADVGPTDVLIKDAELAGRDPGAMIRVAPLRKKKWLGLSLGVFDGGLGGIDARALGLVTARVTSEPTKHLQLGLDGVWRHHGLAELPGVPPTTGPGRALSADVRYSRKRFELRGEWLWGERSDEIFRGNARTFMAAWGIAAVRVPVANVMLMPAARFEWLDADREHPIGRRFLITGALNVMDVSDTLRIVVDVSRSQVQRGTAPLSLAPVLIEASSTAVVVQAQVKL